MGDEKPSFDEFKRQLENLFGRPLNDQATAAAQDFWESWGGFTELIARRSLSVHVDALRLGMNFPEYRRYHPWKGAGKLLIVVGVIAVWFYWPVGVLSICVGLGAHLYGNWVRVSDSKQFSENLMKEATLSPAQGGYAGLCSHYIAGTIALVTPGASAHWPQRPSNVVDGTKSFIT